MTTALINKKIVLGYYLFPIYQCEYPISVNDKLHFIGILLVMEIR